MGGMGGMGGGQGGNQQQQFLMQLLTNPKTAAYLQDPDFIAKLQEIQQNPANIQKYMNDPKIKDALEVIAGGMKGNMPNMPDMGEDPSMSEEDIPKFTEIPKPAPK